MKHLTPQNMSPCKKEKTCSLEEYNSLRNEVVERISIMNNQASNAFGILLTTWAAGFTLLGLLVSFQISDKYEIPFGCLFLLSTGQVLAFLSSLLMLVPMAIKSGENLRQLISLGIYIRVFYDYISKHNDCKQRFLWETADKQVSAFTTITNLTYTESIYKALTIIVVSCP